MNPRIEYQGYTIVVHSPEPHWYMAEILRNDKSLGMTRPYYTVDAARGDALIVIAKLNRK